MDKNFYASKLRSLADEFDRFANEVANGRKLREADNVAYSYTIDKAGKVVIDATKAGYLTGIGGLVELVAWADGKADLPGIVKTFKRCPSNVFNEICGRNRVTVANTDDGIKVISGRRGGLAESDNEPHYQRAANATDDDERADFQRQDGINQHRHQSHVCRWLAAKIEQSDEKPVYVGFLTERELAGKHNINLESLRSKLRTHRNATMFQSVSKRDWREAETDGQKNVAQFLYRESSAVLEIVEEVKNRSG